MAQEHVNRLRKSRRLVSSEAEVESGAQFAGVVRAGGSDGALFQSADEGEHWHRVRVVDSDGPLTSDILDIKIAQPGEVKLRAVNGERWTTRDGGASWIRE
jgi:photosystem II stability/assembly factor-like uncharacterized protein